MIQTRLISSLYIDCLEESLNQFLKYLHDEIFSFSSGSSSVTGKRFRFISIKFGVYESMYTALVLYEDKNPD